MPELPEVETVRTGLAACLPGLRLTAVELARTDLRWPIPVDRVIALRGRRCTAVDRRSKFVLLRFDGRDAPVALVHLGMSGRLFVDLLGRGAKAPAWRDHEHWRMHFGRRLLRYVDPRRFGMLDVVPAADLAGNPLLARLGPEPLGPDFTSAWLWARTRGRKVAIKAFVMNASQVVGVGNIYASEALFHAGIRPHRAAGRLTRAECERLHGAIRDVLRAAIEAGGTTLRDYVGVDEGSGYFQRELLVYGKDGEPCRRCGTGVRHVVIGQRSTYFCPTCQR